MNPRTSRLWVLPPFLVLAQGCMPNATPETAASTAAPALPASALAPGLPVSSAASALPASAPTPGLPASPPMPALPASPPALHDPLVFDTWVPGPCSPNGQPQGQCPPGELYRGRLVPVADGLASPRHIAFTPDGAMLITELTGSTSAASGNRPAPQPAGRVRVVRDGRLVAEPLTGWPVAGIDARSLQAVIVHPQFAANRFVYLYYVKTRPDAATTLAVARARLEGAALADVREIFEADAWIQGGPHAGRAAFGPEGTI